MTNSIDDIIKESERFLREEFGAERYRMVNVLEFIDIVLDNNLRDNVKVRNFKIGAIPFTQVYLELKGEYVYSTTII